MEPPVQTFLQTENISWCPIETTCASSDGTELCTAESVRASMWPERISAEATARGTAITNAINALDVTDAAEANKYVSAVSETDGKISVTRTSLPTIATFTLSGTDLIITY